MRRWLSADLLSQALAHETDSLTETDQRISELLERVSRRVRSDFEWQTP